MPPMDSMPRFVLLHHDHPFTHWDLLLKAGDVLLAWRLHRRPVPNEQIVAERLPDHRTIYLDYEGPISNDRGTVTREESGDFDWRDRSGDSLRIDVRGRWLTGEITLHESAGAVTFQWAPQGFTAPGAAG